ncbi:2,5-diamino-6-(ribosylamino)-4(3H)-pyrimidinone 5'-phosphate reductase [Myotisia sp. PD_48]|nr:2,5-diamino-6-(ribosylamino)-4(3H)-pyrimidinone 5'-phosphate reductase [Myotisia sp. PD_48]
MEPEHLVEEAQEPHGFEDALSTADSPHDADMDNDSELGDADGMDDDDSRLQDDIQAQIEEEGEPDDEHEPEQSSSSDQQSNVMTNLNITTTEGDDAAALGSDPSAQLQPPPPDNWTPYVNPPNIGLVRRLLFELKEPIELSVDEFCMYWPYIDNMWVKQRSTPTRDGLRITDYYMCRLRRPTCKRQQTRSLPDGKRARNKVIREGGTCNFQIRVVKFEGAHTTITLSRSPNSSLTHSHDMDHIDRIKKNSGLMEFVRQEAAKAYLPASIFTKFREDLDQLYAAGGKFLTTVDVRNVSGKWRANHPGIQLRTHEGYSYQNGLGVYKTLDPEQPQLPPGLIAWPKQNPLPADMLPFPTFSLDFLKPYLPSPQQDTNRRFPHITLTYAQSMDGKISLKPGVQTTLSGPDSKLMTHFLRSRHDALIIGLGTAVADDPGLNCRLEGAGGYGGFGNMWQPRPVIVDPTGRWPANPESRLMKTAAEGKGKAPWVIVSPGADLEPPKLVVLKRYGGDFLRIREFNPHWRLRWEAIFGALGNQGIRSVMVEGGGVVLSELLNPEYVDFIDSIIVTTAPVYLGRDGVAASPDSKTDADGNPIATLIPKEVIWHELGKDMIMLSKGRMRPPTPPPQPQPHPILPGLEAAAQGNTEETNEDKT